MERRRQTLIRWTLRAVGLALVALVIVTQISWGDELRTREGEVLSGDVKSLTDGAFLVTEDDGQTRRIDRENVAERSAGVPHVTWGFRTLGLRVLQKPATGISVLLALLLIVVLMGWRWQRLLAAVDVPMRVREAVRLTFVGGFFNIVVPGSTGGDVVKAYYAAKQTGRGTRSVLSVFVDRIIGVFTLVLVAAVALFYLEVSGKGSEGFRVARITVFALLAGGVLGLIVLASRRVRRALGLSAIIRRLPFQRIVEEVGASIRLYRGEHGILLHALAISIVNQIGIALVVYALADALSIDGVDALTCLALVPLMNLLAAVPLLPGGWGVGELAFAYFFGQVGVPATEAVGLSVLFRLSFMAVNLPGGVFWLLSRDQDSRAEIEAVVERASERVSRLEMSAADAAPDPNLPPAERPESP